MAVDPVGRYRLRGRVVTMDDAFTVHDRATIAVDGNAIAGISAGDDDAMPGFEDAPLLDTNGTIYPGLIELHNHLAYNILRLWQVPQKFGNRDEWSQGPRYRKLISGPMSVIGRTERLVPAVVRYVEAKCLLGGVTTSQGIALHSARTIAPFYAGLVRNVEQSGDPHLPNAAAQIADVEAADGAAFLKRQHAGAPGVLILHLAEGVDAAAREHFLALHLDADTWAVTPQLRGIHCVALAPEDFEAFGAHGGAMVWSPLSNLLLYGATADVAAAADAGVTIALGSDWSPSGSKNLLGELKVARAVSEAAGGLFSDKELVAMATRSPARMLGWDAALGSIEQGKRADLLVVAGADGDPYARLIEAGEADLSLVVIDGVARVGTPELLSTIATASETFTVGGAKRELNLLQAGADPTVQQMSLAAATEALTDALARLPDIAREVEARAEKRGAAPDEGVYLALDHQEQPGTASRPHLPDKSGRPTATIAAEPVAPEQLSKMLAALELDPPTVADDPGFASVISKEVNLPASIKESLTALL